MSYYLLFYALLLLYGSSTLGIGPDEAKIIFMDNSFLHTLVSFFYKFSSNEIVVRFPVIAISLLNIALFYRLALFYLAKKDAFFATLLFSLLPAVLASGVIINKAPFIIFLTLIFLLLFHKKEIFAHIFALLLLGFDRAFSIFFLSVIFYYLYKRSLKEVLWYLFLFIGSIALFGFDVGGKPRSYFLDTFAIFAAIFSPLLFFYFFYVIYRIWIKEEKDLLWFMAATSFLFALFLSFRQKIYVVDFAPFAVFGVLLMVKIFLQSYRVRLKKYRKNFKVAFWFVVAVLLLNDVALIFNDQLLKVIPAKKHFAYHYYLAKDLANVLKKRAMDCIDVKNSSLQRQLQFYGIKRCQKELQKPIALYHKNLYLTKFK